MLTTLKPAVARVLKPLGETLARTPVTPNAITVTGTIGVMAGSLGLMSTGHLLAGTIVCTVFVLLDLLDGVLARIKGTSGAWGAFLDSTLDRVADASVFASLAIWFARGGHDQLLAGVALFCLVVGALVSYAKARAEGLGIRCDVGIAERAERILVTLVATGVAGLGVPYILAVGLWLLAAASAVTLGQRMYAVRLATVTDRRQRGEQAPGRPPAEQRQEPDQRQRPAAVGVQEQDGEDKQGTGRTDREHLVAGQQNVAGGGQQDGSV